ncbi:MAG: hypothetical protein JO222_08065, partial [Frankiales bacterium]|nr:hypothetical protein [Frankiales bacterium]
IVAPRTPRGGQATVRVFGVTHTISFRSKSSRYREIVRQWHTAAQNGVTAGSGPTYCMKVTAKSAAPIYVDAIDYEVPDIIE